MSRTSGENDPNFDEILYLNTYCFDLKTKELQDTAGHSVPLRSQSGEVLAYLAAHEGTMVTKDALIAAVWPDTFVTDDSIVQCIGDIRRALGDDAHKIIQTFPKKGYKLVASKGASPPPQRARPWAVPPGVDRPTWGGSCDRWLGCLCVAQQPHAARRQAHNCRAALR